MSRVRLITLLTSPIACTIDRCRCVTRCWRPCSRASLPVYDLAKSFDASVANFWMATPQQLYRELDRLAEQGLIQARVVHQERRPNKRMYSLTEAGYEAIHQFTSRAPKPR